MKDLKGESVGREHSQNASFNLIMIIFALPIGGLEGELLQGAKEAETVVHTVEEGVFLVTENGVVLPKGAKIPSNFIENPYRTLSYGLMENGKFVEKLRIDPATPAGIKGPNVSHYHLNGTGKHYMGNWPWW